MFTLVDLNLLVLLYMYIEGQITERMNFLAMFSVNMFVLKPDNNILV